MVVEGIGDRHQLVYGSAHRRSMARRERRQGDAGVLRGVRQQARFATGTAHGAEPRAAERPVDMQQLQGLQELRQIHGAGDAEPPQQSIRAGVRSGDRCRVAERGGLRERGAAGLQGRDWRALAPRFGRQRFQLGDGVEALDVQS